VIALGLIIGAAVGGVFGTAFGPVPRPVPPPVRCTTPVTYTVAGYPAPGEVAQITHAADLTAAATGQPYVLVKSGAELTISVLPWQWSALLQIDGHEDAGYTAPSLARIDILDTVPRDAVVPLVMHELMLSRGLTEAADGANGHLSHHPSGAAVYSSTDAALLAGSACR
jgi:hypothetical protein